MNPTIAQEIGLLKDFLIQQNDLGIVIGSHQNLDTYAASLSLYLTLVQAGKRVQIISKKSPTVEVSGLVGIDKVKEGFVSGNNSKLVISLPYIKGEVEKVLFTEHPDPQNPTNINFHLTAAPGKSITPFDLKDVKLIWDGGAPNAIIAIGVGTIDEISQVADPNSVKIVNIDNFSGNSRFGDVVIVDESFSSLSEIIGKVIKDLSLPTDLDSAQNILDGVLFATRNFTKPNTSPLAFEAASAAMYVGAQRKGEMPQSQVQQQPNIKQDRRQHDRPAQNQNRQQQRVAENDFPAVHMQNRNQQPRHNSQQRNSTQQQPRPQQQQQFGQNRQQQQPRPQQQQQFGQNSRDIEELMRKINEENARRSGSNQQFNQNRQQQNRPVNNPMPEPMNNPMPMSNRDVIQDSMPYEEPYQEPQIQEAQLVNEPRMSMNEPMVDAPIQNDQMPEDTQYNPPSPSEVPDDWLMPKVFKSSKNNN